MTLIGKGQFSTVYQARNRTDWHTYAVKKTTRISGGNQEERLREVFALASVAVETAACPYIVRYFSSWLEDSSLHIQTELCECSLRDCLAKRRVGESKDPRFGEKDLTQVMQHVSSGLAVLHSGGFVHLDIKPDNILLSRGNYKVADLGLAVAAMGSGCDDISEGDCRYLAKEVLRGDLTDLPKADVFSLGLLCYELATNPKGLPLNGVEWHRLREGHLEAPMDLPDPLVALLHRMVHLPPAERPTCEQICQHPQVARDERQAWLVEQRDAAEARAEALQEEMSQRTREAERNKQLADTYWHEMMSMKRHELLGGIGGHSPSSSAGLSPLSASSPGPRIERHRTM